MGVPRIAIDYGSAVPAGLSREEWEARVLLAACYRVLAHLGWTEMIYNHITLRAPGELLAGTPLRITYSTDSPGKIVVYAVDEGILQVARYATPKPLAERAGRILAQSSQP